MARYYSDEDEPRRWRHDDDEPRTVVFGGMMVVRETPAAVLVREMPGERARMFWVPQSVIHVDSEVYAAGTSGKLVVLAWWAKAKGLTP